MATVFSTTQLFFQVGLLLLSEQSGSIHVTNRVQHTRCMNKIQMGKRAHIHTAQAPTVGIHACKTQRERGYTGLIVGYTAQLAGVRKGWLVVVGTCLRPGERPCCLGRKERRGAGRGRGAQRRPGQQSSRRRAGMWGPDEGG